MPLITELRNGDEVEILLAKAQTPPSAWQSLAVTGKARSAIRRATRDAVRAQYGKLGREILVRAFAAPSRNTSARKLIAGAAAAVAEDRPTRCMPRSAAASCPADVIRAIVPEAELAEHVTRPRKPAQGRSAGRRRLVRPRQGDGPQVPLARQRQAAAALRGSQAGQSRSGACAAICRSTSPKAAPYPATASSASSRQGRASPSIRSTPRR